MVSVNIPKNMLDKIGIIYGRDRLIDLDIRNYYNIVWYGLYFIKKQIVIILDFP